jgi:hypothetical protein
MNMPSGRETVPAGVAVVSIGYHRARFSPRPKTMTSHVAQPETMGEDAGTDAWHHHREERRGDTSVSPSIKKGIDPQWPHRQPTGAWGRRPLMSADLHGCCSPPELELPTPRS